jgi:lysophospholipase L1-like esterase
MDGPGWRRAALRWLGAVAPVLLLTLGGCGDDDAPHVLVVGDSITGLVADDFVGRGEEEFRYTLRATNNATSTDMLAAAREVDDVDFSQVVLNLGTNDAGKHVPIERTRDALQQMIDMFGEADCIHLTTVNEHAVSVDDPSFVDRLRQVNAHLRGLAADDPRIDIIDWSAWVGEYLDAGEPDGSLLYDTVHPTDLGQDRLLDLYVDALETCH